MQNQEEAGENANDETNLQANGDVEMKDEEKEPSIAAPIEKQDKYENCEELIEEFIQTLCDSQKSLQSSNPEAKGGLQDVK